MQEIESLVSQTLLSQTPQHLTWASWQAEPFGEMLAGFSGTHLVFLGMRADLVALFNANPSRWPSEMFNAARELKKSIQQDVAKFIASGGHHQWQTPYQLLGTEFQKKVWRQTQKILPGQVQSYGSVAVSLGKPGAARAVGTALKKNPLLLIVPCHRVTPANGSLGGFAAGTNMKAELLRLEGSNSLMGDFL